jgi:hypothetical protein
MMAEAGRLEHNMSRLGNRLLGFGLSAGGWLVH